MFGEIGILTNLRRTCSVQSQDQCVFQTLDKSVLDKIANMFPSIHALIEENMISYQDEEMSQRR
jgi:hypothetical protein